MTTAAEFRRARLRPATLGACTRQTLRCADARQYGAELRSCCRGHIRQIVADTVPLLDLYGVTFWADYGTLLGAVRNPHTTWADYPWLSQEERPEEPLAPGIVPHDKDADFGVLFQDWRALAKVGADLQRMGYDVLRRQHQGSMKIRLSRMNRSNLDLFTWRDVEGGMVRRVHYISVDTYKGRDFPKARIEPLALVEWEGMTLPAPNDPEEFCAFRYGPNWRTPIPANHDGKRRQ